MIKNGYTQLKGFFIDKVIDYMEPGYKFVKLKSIKTEEENRYIENC